MSEWDQHPDEPENAFRAFCAWRDAGLNRTWQASGFPLADSLKWAAKWSWFTRAKAFDKEFESIRIEARKEAVKRAETETAQTMVQAASAGIQASLNAINAILARQALGDGTAEILKPAEAAKLLDTSTKVWRLIHGESTDNTQIQLEDLTAEELAALVEKFGK